MTTYIFFFIGIVALGDMALIPLIYFAATKTLFLPSVLLVGVLAKTAADSMWYWIGYSFNREKVYNFFRIHKLQKKSPELFGNFHKKADKILFISNFLHGIRIPVRVMYGLERRPFKTFTAINILGSILWLILIAGLAYTLEVSAEELRIYVRRGEIVLAIFFLLLIVFEIWIKKFILRFLKNNHSKD
jgi:membrane protein DedA with SNARE-associated domain